jgi:hypothetical protein
VNVCRRLGHMAPEQVFQKARPAGFEPATRCLEGLFAQRVSLPVRR